MKKYIITMTLCLCFFLQINGQELLFKDFKTTSVNETTQTYNLLNSRGAWPDSQNGSDQPSALIRVTFENISVEEAQGIEYKTSPNMNICDKKFWEQDKTKRFWIWVDSNIKNAYIEAILPGKGETTHSNRLDIPVLEPKGIYEVTLKSDKKLTIHVKTMPEDGVKVFIDGYLKGNANSDIPNIRVGNHVLTISHKGQEKVNETISVSESSVSFGPYDFRERKTVEFKSDPKGAALYINGEMKGTTPLKLELAYDNYNVEAKLGPGEYDQQAITINAASPTEIKMEPIRKKTFEAFATYNGKKVDADLYIDGKQEGSQRSSYTLTKPIGKTYSMNMIYYGNSRKRKIKVADDMSVEQEFKISARNSFVWPWQREYDACPVGISIGYVSKQLVTKGEGEKYKENGVWDDGEGKSLHGMQFGVHFQPCLSWGLGLYSGLFYELYMSSNDEYDYDEFMEHCIYIPVHAYYRLPFANKIALSIHGGLGFNYSVHGAYTDSEDTIEDYTDFYGEDAFPKRFNMAAEIGAGFRVGPVQINAQYSKGITNHKSYESLGDYKTTQNKLSLSVSYVIGSN